MTEKSVEIPITYAGELFSGMDNHELIITDQRNEFRNEFLLDEVKFLIDTYSDL